MKKLLIGFCLSLVLTSSAFAARGDYTPARTAVTQAQNNVGFNYNVFNMYRGQAKLANNIRYQSNVTSYGDERDFLVAKPNGTPSGTAYNHTMTGLGLGDEVLVQAFIHNSARETTSNTYRILNVKAKLDWTNPGSVKSTVTGNGVTTITDIASFGFSQSGLTFERIGTVRQVDNFGNLTTLSNSDNGTMNTANVGTVVGSYKGSRHVYWILKVVKAPASCTKSVFDKTNVIPGEKTTFSWMTQNLQAGSKLKCSGAGVSIDQNAAANGSKEITIPVTATAGQVLTCKITNPNGSNLCSDTVTVKAPVPAIKIDKDDSTPGTADTDGNDTQTLSPTDKTANFTIKVTNTGTEPLKNVAVTDPESTSCARTAAQARVLIQAVGNNDNILDPNESFSYTCEKADVTAATFADGDNDANVVGTGVITNQQVTDTDPTVVKIPEPSIVIDKDDSTPGTNDTDGNDTQRVEVGGTAIFTIKVTNDGEVGLKKVLIKDTLAPSCAKSIEEALPMIRAVGNKDAIFDVGESFTYTCEDTNVIESYTNVATTEGISAYDDTTKVLDSDPTEVVVGVPAGPAINIDKDDSTPGTPDTDGNDTQTIVPNGTANFTIKVTNTGNEALKDVVINDPEATSCARTAAQTLPLIQAVGNNNNVLDPNESFDYTCTKENVTASTFADGDNDSDVAGVGVTSNTTVTDEDPTQIQFLDGPAIDIDKDDSTPGTVDTDGDDTQTIARGGTATFTIKVTNTGSEGLKDVRVDDALEPSCARTVAQALPLIQAIGNNDSIFDQGESFTYTCEDTGVTDSYTNSATTVGKSVVDDQEVNDVDPTVIVVGGGSNGPSIDIDKDDSTPGTPDSDGNDTQKLGSGGGTATFTIKVTNDGNIGLRNVRVTDLLSPDCERTAAQTLPLIQNTGNNNDIFDINETFTYVCTIDNVTSAFTNTATVVGEPIDGQPNVTDTDTTTVTIGTGGGGGETIPSVGTCSVHDITGAYQCTNRRPVRDPSDPLWNAYRRCAAGDTNPRNTAPTRTKACAIDWAEDQDLKLCGANISGVIDPFATPTPSQIAAQCGVIIPPLPPSPCVPVASCPECFKVGAVISKQILDKSSNLVKKITTPKSDTVTYEVTVGNLNFDKAAYQILTGKIKVYDMTIPSASGNIYNRDGIIDGDANATWTWCGKAGNCAEDKDYFQRTLTAAELSALNNNGFAEYKVHYDMNTSLAAKKDTTQITNVAYAVIEYTYKNRANPADSGFRRIGIGNNACNPPTVLSKASISSLGSSAQVKIIRPFVRAKAGNIGIQSSQFEKVTGKPQTVGEIMSDNNLFVPDVLTMDEFDELGNFQNVDNNDFYENLNQNTAAKTMFGGNFRTHEYESGVYFANGDLELKNLNFSSLSQSVTIVVENGNLIIDQDFKSIPAPHFIAFVVKDGDILIDKAVQEIHGTYLVERGQIKAKNDEISETQLKVSGNLIGNLAHLLSFRKYIGSGGTLDADGFPVPEPSLIVSYDLRLLENTPPILEQFLGTDWREEVQG